MSKVTQLMGPVACTGKHSRGRNVAGEMEHGVWVFLNKGALGTAWGGSSWNPGV